MLTYTLKKHFLMSLWEILKERQTDYMMEFVAFSFDSAYTIVLLQQRM